MKTSLKKILISFIFILFLSPLFSQQKFAISGYIKDAKTGEDLIGATLSIKEIQGKGCSTNAYGFYSVTLLPGHYQVTAQYVGYSPQTEEIILTQATNKDFLLNEAISELDEIVVTGERKDENLTRTQMGIQKLDTKDIKTIPVIFGEKDLLKTIQLLPGIKSAGEGSSGFNVRGGASDQNLILLDEATVYNASHLMGFFSVFNSNAIKDISVYKGNEPAEYGGRLSSILDIKMNEGNDKEFGFSAGIGLISSNLNIEGPIIKNKSSFSVSARRTYADLFLKASPDTTLRKARLFFYDLNVKTNYRINNKNRLYLSGYFGKDVLGLKNLIGINWGNSTATFRWNHLFSDRIFSNTSLIFSNYDYKINIENSGDLNIISRIQDYGLKYDFQFFASTNSTFKFGLNTVYHKMVPGAITTSEYDIKSMTNKYAWETSFYLSHHYDLNDKTSIEYGTRITSFSIMGPGNFYSFDANGNASDTTHYDSGQFGKSYLNIEPRISVNFNINRASSIKASYARNIQNLHLLSNSTSGSPTDLWIPSSNNVKPEIADQVSIGYFRNFFDNKYEFSLETYYKNMQNQIDYKNNAQLNYNEFVESQILFGRGRAYGLELFIKKRYGRLNGWVSYTLSRTERKFEEINGGNYYPARQDRTHDVSIVGMYDLSDKWTLSATWVLSTGNPFTSPTGKYEIDGETRFYYSDRNANRMPSYHRLDLGATWTRKKTAKFESGWTFSLYNAYGHDNAYMITFRENEKDPSKTEAVQTTLFKFVPSFSYNIKF